MGSWGGKRQEAGGGARTLIFAQGKAQGSQGEVGHQGQMGRGPRTDAYSQRSGSVPSAGTVLGQKSWRWPWD